ncbi:DUF4844 domain-containing protein [Sphingobacterium siyangense]|uniref:DUF4844 domain-containing protein n=1 Tax=Sphingobacterium TaxID=28453 RepID=UPI0009582E94|nr:MULTISPECIES: DUF4844 domain-containing protein [Sphingobacterium]APU97950.1 hypothetical protein BV902_17735 [Sphingobacterium sp. B29]UQA73377.1 DUF4844 domain-containing protein [Sphingobacterium siyangense]
MRKLKVSSVFITAISIILIVFACNKKSNYSIKHTKNLEILKKEPKFQASAFYPGLEKRHDKKVLSDLLNDSIDDFIEGTKDNFDEAEYKELLKESLQRFETFNLDTEDREYVSGYFEKIMDAVELKSSGGVLNNGVYNRNF